MDEATNTQPGMCIENRYRIVRKIAEGGMATVYQAQDERLGRPVAIKIMHTQLAQGLHRQQFIARFRREATSAAAIANPHIVQVYDTGEYDGLDYLVMEYVHGVNLRYEMNVHGTFTVKETLRLLAEVLDGLSSAHQAGVVHRDIKPENILINDRGHVQITDFGLARAISQATLSSTGLLLGTAAYLAPEMIENNLATTQGDLYSAGMMAWEMLAGRVPFSADNPVTLVFKHVHEDTPSLSTVCEGISPIVADFISSLTQRDMHKRPDDATMALAKLRSISSKLSPEDWKYRLQKEYQADEEIDSNESPVNKLTRTAESSQEPPIPPTTPMVLSSEDDSKNNNSAQSDSDYKTYQNITDEINRDEQEPIFTNDSTLEANNNADSTKASDSVGAREFYSDSDSTRNIWNNNRDAYASNQNTLEDFSNNSYSDPLEQFNDNNLPTTALNSHELRKLTQLSAESKNKTTERISKGSKKSYKKVVIILACFASVAALSVAGGCYWYFAGPGSYWSLPKPDDLSCKNPEVCKITNVLWKDYERTLKVSGIPYDITEAFDDDIAAGKIVKTDPELVGSHLSKHSNGILHVVVSKGIRQATIPQNIMDPNTEDGKKPIKALKKAGFTNIIHSSSVDDYSLYVPDGAVLAISPEPGTRMNHNKPVKLVLSKGPMPVQMPDIANKTKDDATSALRELKLKVTSSEENSDTVDKGKIISTSPSAGTQLHWGDEVKIVVSKGPQTVKLPNVCGKNTDEARKILETLGLSVKVQAPLGDLMHVVRFQSPGVDTEVRVKDSNGNPTVITLTVI